ncbi:MAG: 2-C-methyl-D-erythritol 4-phosphate cytidylyltransferase [Actinomycetota bacterium]
MTAWAIVVAAGSGTRLGGRGPKALTPLGGEPMLAWSLDAIVKAGSIRGVVVACGPGWAAEAEDLVRRRFQARGRVVGGGATRQESVRLALDRIAGDADRVVVHDAARPLAAPELFERALAALEGAAGAVCAIPVADTIKKTSGKKTSGKKTSGDVVAATIDRTGLWRAQTPQAFRTEALLRAHAEAAVAGFVATDDAMLLERAGETVVVVRGDERNIKVTTQADLALAEAMLSR